MSRKSNGVLQAGCSRVAIAAVAASMIMGEAPSVNAQDADDEILDISLEEIIITARRREENLQETPISVSAFTEQTLQRRNIASATDLDVVTPNLQLNSTAPASGNNSSTQIFIRGVGQSDPLPGVDPGVGLYVDDIYLARSVGSAIDFLDIESVQVLRGPQGTLFGRNTIGGAILVTTKDPGTELALSSRLGVGSDSLYEFASAIDVPLTDTLGVRVSGGFRKRNGFVTQASTGIDLGDDDTFNLRAKLVWQPSEQLSLKVSAGYVDEDENGAPLVFAGSAPDVGLGFVANLISGCVAAGDVFDQTNPNCYNDQFDGGPFVTNGTADVGSTFEGFDISAILEYSVNDILSFKSITGYRDSEWFGARDADHSPITLVHTTIDAEHEQFSQELQAQVAVDNFEGIIGVFYFEETASDFFRIELPGPNPGPGPVRNDAAFDNDSYAIFGQASYSITDRLEITAGARYTEETKRFTGNQFLEASNVFFISNDEFEESFDNFSIAASAQYQVTDDISTYFSYSEGFKSGGLVSRYAAPIPGGQALSFDEENATTYELGFKADVLDKRLRVNAALFTSKYDDIQVAFRLGPTPTLFNAGEATVEGFELEWTYLVTENLIFEGGIGYLDTGYDSIRQPDPVLGVPITGGIPEDAELAYAPEWAINLGASYNIQIGNFGSLIPRVDFFHQSSVFFDAVNTVEIAQNDSYSLVNLSATFESDEGNWRAHATVINVGDVEYRVAGFSGLAAAGYSETAFNRGREWRLSLEFDF